MFIVGLAGMANLLCIMIQLQNVHYVWSNWWESGILNMWLSATPVVKPSVVNE